MPERKVSLDIQNDIKKYILTHKNEINIYTWTRVIIVTYLTLMNGRWGQEVALLTLKVKKQISSLHQMLQY